MITLLDYGAGNVRSVINALETIGARMRMVTSPDDILSAEKLIFPGVGNFESMMQILREKEYVAPLQEYLKADRPFFGICLGMQALFETSAESESRMPGLGIFQGEVLPFETDLPVPHMGWNGINIHRQCPLLEGIAQDERFYFVHSYHIAPREKDIILATTTYDYEFVSAVSKGNITATQFHPEKSGKAGLLLLENFVRADSLHSKPIQPTRGAGISRRIIACLDVRSNDDGNLVVTKGDQYDVREKGHVRNLGKPVELASRYFQEGADEIAFLNITGFRDFPLEDLPMCALLEQVSEKVFVPLTIGGGIRSYTDSNGKTHSAMDVVSCYFRSGADKVSIGSDAVHIAMEYLKTGKKTGQSTIEQISARYGNQAVVISVDPKRVWVSSPEQAAGHHVIQSSETGPNQERYCWYQCTVQGGRKAMDIDAVTLAKACQELGAGEILLNCIDRDGTGRGFDLDLISAVADHVDIPVIASSGAGSPEHFSEVFTDTRAQAALAAGIFHRKEVPIGSVKQHLSDQNIPVRRS